jgi:outer membrane receptor protein involved in Fe transport
MELQVPLPHGIVARAAYTAQDARDDTGGRLSNSPLHLGQAGIVAPLVAHLDAAAELLVVGPRRTLAGRRLETAHILSLTLNYRTPIRNLKASAGLYNLFNQTYPDPSGIEHRQDRIPQDGLTFRLQLQYAF